jgi:tetratricopeptide (TPR) repeat protein
MGSRHRMTIARLWLLAGCLCFPMASQIWASTGDISNSSLATDYAASAGVKAIGSAGVASSRGIDALYDNPAGLGRSTEHEVGFTYVGLFDSTYYSFIGYVNPLLSRGSVGLGWARITSFGFTATDASGNPLGGFNDAQNVFYLGYGYPLQPGLQIGADIKGYYQDLYQYRSVGFGLDLGAQYKWFKNMALGINLQNLASVPIQSGETSEPLPARIRTGLSWSPDTSYDWLNPLTAHFEYDWEDLWGQAGGITKYGDSWKLGLDYAVQGFMEIKAGLRSQNLTMGASFHLDPVKVEYAYDIHDLGGLHWFTVQWAIGGKVGWAEVNQHATNALQLYEQGNYRGSLKEWERVLELDPDNVAASQYMERTRQELAVELDQRQQEARAALATKDYAAALRSMEEAERLDPGNSAISLMKQEVKAAAEEQARQERIAKADELREQARRYYRQSQWIQALEAWEAVAKLLPDDVEAANEIKTLKGELITLTDTFFSDGVRLYEQKKYVEAGRKFEGVLKIDPQYTLAVFYLSKTKQALAAELKSKYLAAVRAVRKHEYPRGIRLFNEVLKADPNYRDAQRRLDLATERMAEWQKVLLGYQDAKAELLKAEPARALAIMTPFMERHMVNDEMVAFCAKAQKVQAESRALFYDGVRKYQADDLEGAITSFRGSMKLDRQSEAGGVLVETYLRKGVLAYRQNDLAGALAAWKNVQALQKDHRMVKLYIQRVLNKMKYIQKMMEGPK